MRSLLNKFISSKAAVWAYIICRCSRSHFLLDVVPSWVLKGLRLLTGLHGLLWPQQSRAEMFLLRLLHL